MVKVWWVECYVRYGHVRLRCSLGGELLSNIFIRRGTMTNVDKADATNPSLSSVPRTARELIRAKIAAKDEDNCDPGTNDGCRYEACSERGLSSVLHKLASSPFSPLNAPGPVHFALLPILKPLKVLLDDLSQGKLKLSEVCTAAAQFSARNSRRAIRRAIFRRSPPLLRAGGGAAAAARGGGGAARGAAAARRAAAAEGAGARGAPRGR